MKDLMITRYLDIYGSLLTEKQTEMLRQYYDLDYSLSEIADNFGVSRQAVHAAIRQASDSLRVYEQKIGLMQNMQALADSLQASLALLQTGNGKQAATDLCETIKKIRSDYGTIQQFE